MLQIPAGPELLVVVIVAGFLFFGAVALGSLALLGYLTYRTVRSADDDSQ